MKKVTITEEFKIPGTEIVLEAGDVVQINEARRTPSGWEYDPRDSAMSGYPTLTKDVSGEEDDQATVTYIPEDKIFQVMSSNNRGDFNEFDNPFEMLISAKRERIGLTAEDLLYFLGE